MTYPASVRWLAQAIRGTSHLPPTLRYVALSRFPEDGPQWPDGAWSVELRFAIPPSEQTEGLETRARVRFLMDDAPAERLRPGARFRIYEGPTPVAEVEVVGPENKAEG